MFQPLSTLFLLACFLLKVLSLSDVTLDTHLIVKRNDDAKLAEPIPPSEDPFYTAPSGFEEATPGTILRMRQAPGNLSTLVGNCSAVYNILYRSTDSQYLPSWAVTTIFVPLQPKNVLVSYQIWTDSAWIDAFPSYSLYNDEKATTGFHGDFSTLLVST